MRAFRPWISLEYFQGKCNREVDEYMVTLTETLSTITAEIVINVTAMQRLADNDAILNPPNPP